MEQGRRWKREANRRPGRRPGRLHLSPLAAWLAFAACAFLLGFAFIGTRGLWEPDEGRYAESAREMLVSGDFMTPHLRAQAHFTKPPMTYWLIAGSMAVLGPTEIAVRLPTALC